MQNSIKFQQQYPIWCAIALALGAAIALGISRFSYTLFLPLMREDLNWSYFISGNMNTANAIGYLVGALTCNWVFERMALNKVFLWSTFATICMIALMGFFKEIAPLFLVRFLVGVTSTWVFVGGGALVAKVSVLHPKRSGWILGIYYGGVGFGIVLSSIFVHPIESWASSLGYEHAWQFAWWGMALVALLMGLLLYSPVQLMNYPIELAHINERISVRKMWPMNVGYFLYGLGYIGYMTFSVALVREIGFTGSKLDYFYGLLGLFIMFSSKIWSVQLDKKKDGAVLGAVSFVLAIACFIPAFIALMGNESTVQIWQISLLFISAMMFGSSMVTAVASTTAFVKHNLPSEDWLYGIQIFTIAFAIGQIVGPVIVGYLSDLSGSLGIGLLFSGTILLIGSYISYQQKSLIQEH
jgi:predicted MFS family arabinose efflux permease